MDAGNFDDLTRRLATGTSRRRVLRSLVGVAAGGLAALAARATGATVTTPPTCRGAGRRCAQNANCCSGFCDTTNADPHKRYLCTCPPGTEICRGQCVVNPDDFQDDAENCGGCGNQCLAPVANAAPVCCGGTCDYACLAGYQQCGVSCFPTSSFPLVISKPTIEEAMTDTGIVLQAGDSVVITVTGTNDIDGVDPLGTVGPNGYPGTSGMCLEGIDCGAAIARIGGGGKFFIGAGPTVVTASSAGNLFIGSHDLAGAYDVTGTTRDNVGTFTFTINCNTTTTGCQGPIS